MDMGQAADCEAIRQIIARYNLTGDTDDFDGYAGCFAEDALFEAPGFRHQGREAIRAWKGSHRIFGEAAFRMHMTTGTCIEFSSPDAARAVSNWMALTNSGPDHAGRYHDRFERTAEGWRIAERRVDILWRAETSKIGAEHVGRTSVTAD